MRAAALFLACIAIGAAAAAGGAAVAEEVEIPHGEATLKAVLFRPEGAGPFPAVVGLHGCSGLLNRSGQLGTRYRDWGERLAAAGYVVLYPDSFGARGITSQCTVRERRVRSSHERVADAHAARRWLQGREWVRADRVALIGWSSGATAALWTVRPRAGVRDGAPDFRSAVAFYPGCRRLNELAWSARVPTLVLIGAADDWTPASACQQMIRGARGRTAHAEIVTYPDAHHDFDHPNRPIAQRSGLAFSADGSGRAHVATNPPARADALKRVPEWLAR
ncbi:MAG: dienelactone hydrolase family protein [Xanthobacteraceae bacterium]